MCSACSNARTAEPNRRFRNAVKTSCSIFDFDSVFDRNELQIPRCARDDKTSTGLLYDRLNPRQAYSTRRKAAYPSQTASTIRATAGTHRPHTKPRNAREEPLNIA